MYGVKTKLEIAKDIYNAKLLVLVDAEMYLAFLKKILLRDPNVAPTVSTLEKKIADHKVICEVIMDRILEMQDAHDRESRRPKPST